jgi:superfamily I DNA/RNA helicase
MDDTWWRNADQLDDDQKNIIALPLSEDCIVLGPPGSGKTNLLLLRAAFLSRAGYRNIAIVTFNRLLKEFIASGSAHYPFEPSRIKTMISWGNELLHSAGEQPVRADNFKVARSSVVEALSILKGSNPSGLEFDCILVDEAQDYSVEEIDLFRHFSKRLYAVGDNNQRIYAQGGAISHLQSFCNSPAPLKFHYRNGQAICKFADAVRASADAAMLDTCNYDESTAPSTVTRLGACTIEQQVQVSVAQLTSQLLAYPGQWIGLLAPKNDNVNDIYNALQSTTLADKIQVQSQAQGYDTLDPDRPIILSTIHSSKGLEYRAVHLFALDQISVLSNSRRVAYTAITRAKTSLSVYHNGALPGYIESGLQAVNGAPIATPSLSDLFGKS